MERQYADELQSQVVAPRPLRDPPDEGEGVEHLRRAIGREGGRRRQDLEVQVRGGRDAAVADQPQLLTTGDPVSDPSDDLGPRGGVRSGGRVALAGKNKW